MLRSHLRMILIGFDAELTVISHADLCPHAIMTLLCCDDIVSSMANFILE